jgi:hypothetical protein
MDRTISPSDRAVLRRLAARVAEIATQPTMDARRRAWVEHNSLRSLRPMMLVFPEGSWNELLPDSSLACQGEFARSVEAQLRMRIYTYVHFQDDSVIEAEWTEAPAARDTGWGVQVERQAAPQVGGAWAFRPVVRGQADLKKLHYPDLEFDPVETARREEQMSELFAGLLRVEPFKIRHISYHLMSQYSDWCGLEEMLTDFADRPDFVHSVLRFLEEGHRRLLDQVVEANLLGLNNNNTYHSSGGNGYTDHLPAPGFDPARVRPLDLWASAESQELAQVSPRMHAEFALAYEARLLAPFGLSGYGCCEDLSRKLELVFQHLPNLRRVSISPFADVDRCAPQVRGRAIFSWKPHPSQLVGNFDPTAVRAYICHTLAVCRENDCFLEMILKDTHTCENHPERFDAWTAIAREEIQRAFSA